MSFKVYGLHIWLFGIGNPHEADAFPLHFISPVTTFLGRGRRGAMAALDFEHRVAQRTAIREHMDKIGRKILVMSGKGGVGKTTIAVGLAQALAARGERVGILDTDLHGPNVAKMLHVDLASRFSEGPDGFLVPVDVNGNLRIAGVDSAMEDKEDAIIWRGPMKSMVINDLLARVDWGRLDYLLIDSPPGSGDEQLTVCKSIPELTGAIIVTTAQEVSLLDAVRSVTFCRKMGIAIIGIVENMSSFVCPDCGSTTAIFGSEGGRRIAARTGTPFLGSVPLVAHRSDGTSNSHALDEALDEIARIIHEGMTCSSVEER
jgi:Mrp family chromosome partitioning ATPase